MKQKLMLRILCIFLCQKILFSKCTYLHFNNNVKINVITMLLKNIIHIQQLPKHESIQNNINIKYKVKCTVTCQT